MVRALFLFVFLFTLGAFAAKQEMPPSFSFKKALNIKSFKTPKVNLKNVVEEDLKRDAEGLPPRFAKAAKVSINPQTQGSWLSLNDKEDLWTLRVNSKDAVSLNLAFTDFYLPKGSKLFFYGSAKSQVRGPFTEVHNNKAKQLWTPIILGSSMNIELLVPKKARNQVKLQLTKINHGYRGFGKAMQKSGSCNIDVACNQRSGWEDQIQSVAVISTGGSTFVQVFVNNTGYDQRPLFMTAHHCSIGSAQAPSLVAYWNFQNSTCRGPSQSGGNGDGNLDQFTTGATWKAGGAASDFTIVEFNQDVDPDFNPFYAGWDARLHDPISAVGIHHPATDEKRISFENDPTSTTDYLGTSVPGDGTHIRITDWDVGTTEPGSSGSPLFDQNKRVVGQLHGGGAACGNNDSDWYGRISYSWNQGLKEVLDPAGTGEMYIDGIGSEVDYMAKAELLSLSSNSVNPGDLVEAKFKIVNKGLKPITNLESILTTSVGKVSIENANRSVGNINSKEEVELSYNILFANDFTCGDVAPFKYEYSSANVNGGINFEITTGEPVSVTESVKPNLSIPDNNAQGITSEILFANRSAVIKALKVNVNIEHTYVGDLVLELRSPSGKSIKLHNQTGGSDANIVGVYPDDLNPAESLDVFKGENVSGTWSLKAVDTASQDTGALKSWSLIAETGVVCR